MSKQKNENIGHGPCLVKGCAEVVAVRRNRSGKLYADCPRCGRITPNLAGGQDALLERANIWGSGGAPVDCPRWIAEQWPWGRVMSDPTGRGPVGGATPSTGKPKPAPVHEDRPGVPDAPPPPPPKPESKPEPQPEPQPEEASGFTFFED